MRNDVKKMILEKELKLKKWNKSLWGEMPCDCKKLRSYGIPEPGNPVK